MNAPPAGASRRTASSKQKKKKEAVMEDSAAAGADSSSAAKLTISTRAHIAGLKRLSERANSASSSSSAATPGLILSPRKVSFSFTAYGASVIQHLKSCTGGMIRIDPGLTDEEIERIQAAFHFTFPPDLRGILQQGLPLGPGFPDWRSQINSQKLKLWISMPKSSLCSDAELGLFWWRAWGVRPSDPVRAAQVARAAMRRSPVLIPVYGRCFLPAAPVRAGNPVLFLEQSSSEAFYCAREISEFFHKQCLRSFLESSWGCASSDLYIPEPIEARSSGSFSGSLETARRMIARCASSVGEDHHPPPAAAAAAEESWGRSVDALADRRSSSVSARSVLTGARASSSYGSRSSDGSSDDQTGLSSSSHFSSGKSGVRRIEFWSDLVEKRQSMNCAAGWSTIDFCEDADDGFVQLQQVDAEHCLPDDRNLQESSSSASDEACEGVKEAVKQMTDKLRNAGWNEKDVAEIMDSCEQSRSSKSAAATTTDRQSVLEGLATQLDFLSSCLREAGWSLNDITESLCFDLSGFSEPTNKARVMRGITPEVASRIGVLAAFVAQG